MSEAFRGKDGKNDPYSPDYTLSEGDLRVVQGLLELWEGQESLEFDLIDLIVELRKLPGKRNCRRIEILSEALLEFVRELQL